MKIRKIDHISIAVKDIAKARQQWEPILGKTQPDDFYVYEREQIRVARYWIGEVGFELMESTSSDGPVSKYIEKNGEGIMLISLNVDDTRESIKELEERGYQFIPDHTGHKARPFRNCEFAFIHPNNLNGVLLEVIDDKGE